MREMNVDIKWAKELVTAWPKLKNDDKLTADSVDVIAKIACPRFDCDVMPVDFFNSSKMATEYVSRCYLTWYDRILDDYYTSFDCLCWVYVDFIQHKTTTTFQLTGVLVARMHVDARARVWVFIEIATLRLR